LVKDGGVDVDQLRGDLIPGVVVEDKLASAIGDRKNLEMPIDAVKSTRLLRVVICFV
jgi:hypothetical protein